MPKFLTDCDLSILWMLRRHAPVVTAIDSDEFDEPWTESDFQERLSRRDYFGWVAELSSAGRQRAGERLTDAPIGYIVYRHANQQLEILRMAVEGSWQRHGVGHAILRRIQSRLRPGRHSIFADVPIENYDAQKLFASVGFKAVSILDPVIDQEVIRFRYVAGQPTNAEAMG